MFVKEAIRIKTGYMGNDPVEARLSCYASMGITDSVAKGMDE